MHHVRHGRAKANGIELAYEDLGDPEAPPMLLVMGFGAQLTLWPDQMCAMLADRGFRVIRFDNRDIGLSSKIEGQRVRGSFVKRLAFSQLGRPSEVPYTLHDMADDAAGLLDDLGLASAHVVGASMGGMITQSLAARHPDRVRSVGIIFSSTNEPLLPPPAPAAIRALITGPPKGASREQIVEHSVRAFRVLGSPAFPPTDDELREKVRASIERSYYPAGVIRQLAAVLGTGSLKPYAQAIDKPAVVLHGASDPLLRPACGKAVARAIKGARLHLIDGMGHDLPEATWGTLVEELARNAADADESHAA